MRLLGPNFMTASAPSYGVTTPAFCSWLPRPLAAHIPGGEPQGRSGPIGRLRRGTESWSNLPMSRDLPRSGVAQDVGARLGRALAAEASQQRSLCVVGTSAGGFVAHQQVGRVRLGGATARRPGLLANKSTGRLFYALRGSRSYPSRSDRHEVLWCQS